MAELEVWRAHGPPALADPAVKGLATAEPAIIAAAVIISCCVIGVLMALLYELVMALLHLLRRMRHVNEERVQLTGALEMESATTQGIAGTAGRTSATSMLAPGRFGGSAPGRAGSISPKREARPGQCTIVGNVKVMLAGKGPHRRLERSAGGAQVADIGLDDETLQTIVQEAIQQVHAKAAAKEGAASASVQVPSRTKRPDTRVN